MNRRQKIIISVTGIFIVMLILVGLTYAYFLTQITGNTKDKSISVTTANLVVRYEDGTNIILDENTKLKPSSNAIGTKTFDVVNEGDETDYVVIVDNISIKDATTGESTTFKTNDFVYTLECTSGDGNDCSDVNFQTTLPLKNESILVGNRISTGVTHSYTLTLWYLDSGENQSDDMNKTLEARINIEDIRRLENPYENNTNSLAYNIINNSLNATNGTQLMGYPLTKVAEEMSSQTEGTGYIYASNDLLGRTVYYASTKAEADKCSNNLNCSNLSSYTTCNDDVIGKYLTSYDYYTYGPVIKCNNGLPVLGDNVESVLSVTNDDYGTSYYYRGNVADNYVNFAGMCWRVVRIDGKGNIKLILEDKNTTCDSVSFSASSQLNGTSTGFENKGSYQKLNYLEPDQYVSESMVKTFYDFQKVVNDKIEESYINRTISNYLVYGDWCWNDNAYSSYNVDLLNVIPFTEEEKNQKYLANTLFYYDSYIRLSKDSENKKPTFQCRGKKMNKFKNLIIDGTQITTESDMYVATLTADEIVYAGATTSDGTLEGNQNYYLTTDYSWLSLSPSYFVGSQDFVFYIMSNSLWDDDWYANGLRPAINLKDGIEIESGGNGTKTNPYVVK